MTNLLVVGIGGVGGYFGGLLAQHYEDHPDISIYFLARGDNAEAIKMYGLQVKDGEDLFLARPRELFSNLSTAPKMDYVLVCTKSYHLNTVLPQLDQILKPSTVLLPLLNGVEPGLQIQQTFPNHLVAFGCTYLVSQLTHPGKIDNSGSVQQIYFGSTSQNNERLKHLEVILKEAEINADLCRDIESIVWEKYIFIAAIATATSYYDATIGAVIEDDEKYEQVLALITEACAVAAAKHIALPVDIANITAEKIQKLPYAGTSSMHRDFSKGGSTELENLTGFVLRESAALKLSAPTFQKMYTHLAAKAN